MRIVCPLLLALVAFGCSPPGNGVKCSGLGSSLRVGGATGMDSVTFEDACTYEVTKHEGAGCDAWDVTLKMTAFVPMQAQKHDVGLVYTLTSLDNKGTFTTDPSKLCTDGGYYTAFGDWTSKAANTIYVPWRAPDMIDAVNPVNQRIDAFVTIDYLSTTGGWLTVNLTHE
jgi:hypothetical protein